MRQLCLASALLTAGALLACSSDSMMSPSGALQVLGVEPAAASTGVSVFAPITVTFSRPMMVGMESRILLHEGTVKGSEMSGNGSWSADKKTFTFVPAAPLKTHTTYVLHLAADMRGADGNDLDHGGCTVRGGSAVTGAMMSGQAAGSMMGSGWRAGDGGYGMIFSFATG